MARSGQAVSCACALSLVEGRSVSCRVSGTCEVGCAMLRRPTTAFRETPNLRGGTTNRRPHGLMAMSTCNPPLCDTHGGGFKSTPPQRRICKQFTVTFGQLFFRPCPNACVSPRATPVPPISMLVLTPSQTGAGCWLAVILLGLLDRPPDRTPCRTANNSLRHGTKIPRVTG